MEKIDKMNLAEVEDLIEEVWEKLLLEAGGFETYKLLEDCLRHRRFILNDGFRLTDQELARFRVVAGMFVEKSELILRNVLRIYRQAHEQMKSGNGGDFSGFCVEASVRVVYGRESPIWKMEDDSGSNYHAMAEILECHYADISSQWPMSRYFPYRPDETFDEEFYNNLFGADFDGNGKIDTTRHDGVVSKFSKLLEVPVCNALHNLFDHTCYSLPDIIRINDVWSEVSVTWQNFYPN